MDQETNQKAYDLSKPWKSLDPWQEDLQKTEKDICIVSGRQCGKSTAISILAANEALKTPNSYILIGAYVIDQTELIFWKIKDYILSEHPKEVVGRPTLHFLQLKNGSKIFCRAIGDTGAGMRGHTATMIIIDEAAFVPDRAWVAIEPIISVSKGRTILLSTPQGKSGFFYKASINEDYYVRTISARTCPRHTKKFLDQKEAELSPVAFATEYLGEFIDDYNRKFTDEWIEKVCTLPGSIGSASSQYFLGVDVGAGVGKGETTFEGFGIRKGKIFQATNIFSNTIAGPDIERQIKELKLTYNYGRKSIGYDSRGEGSGSFKYMMEDDELKRCMVALDNATRPVDRDGNTTKLLKEFMYDLVEEMGWRGDLRCFKDPAVKQSFRSIQIEFKHNGDRKYSGAYDHIVEGIIRGVWLAKHKSLNLYFY